MNAESVTLQGTFHEIERAARFADEFCRSRSVGPTRARTLILILEELVTNTLKHGHPPQEATIEVTLDSAPEGLVVVYRDRGTPFDPTRDVPEQDLSATVTMRQTGGLGWPLIWHYCTRVRYRREGDENVIELLLNPDPGR